MILLQIEAKDDREKERKEARRADGKIPEPDSYPDLPPLSAEDLASIPWAPDAGSPEEG